MSLNLYSIIIKTLTDNGQDANLEQIGKINTVINDLINRGVSKEWIQYNIEILI